MTGCVGKLESVVCYVEILFVVSTHVNQRDSLKTLQPPATHPAPIVSTVSRESHRPKHAKAREIPRGEGGGDEIAGGVTETGPNAGTFRYVRQEWG